MSTNYCSPIGKIRAVVIICCLALILGVFGYAYMSDTDDVVLSKEDILTTLEELEGEDLGFDYVSSYVKKYGLGNLNSYKFNEVENKLESLYYEELPEENELAALTVRLFLEEFYDTVDLNNKNDLTDALLKCMISSIGDPYAFYRTVDEYNEYSAGLEGGDEFVGIGVSINAETYEILVVFNGSGAEDAGIENADVITGVDGVSVEGLTVNEVANMIRGEEGTTVTVTVMRRGELIDFTVERRKIIASSVVHRMLDGGIGYIQITQFLAETPGAFEYAVDECERLGAEALIIDVRNNPGGLLYSVEMVIDYLTPDADTRMIDNYTDKTGKYVCYTTDNHSVDIPIVVLCNADTASAGELFTAAMRDFGNEGVLRTSIIGTQTFGKGIVQSSYYLYDSSAVTFTIGYYNPPCDVNFHGEGIIPEEKNTIEKTVGYDEQLDAAIEEAAELIKLNKGAAVSLPSAA